MLLPLTVVFLCSAVVAGLLGLIGVLELKFRGGYGGLNAFDVVHSVFQLYTSQTPAWLANDTNVPTSYDVAKVMAPMSTAYAFAATATVLVSERWRAWRARRARNHAIVCGGGRSGVFLARSSSLTVTTVFIDRDASSEGVATSLVRRVIPLSGDGRDSVVQLRAGLPRAATVFAIDEVAEFNAAVAMSARNLWGDREDRLNCYAVIDDSELQIALQARILSNVRSSRGFQLHLLERDQLFASAVVKANPPDPFSDTIVEGRGRIGVALVFEAAKYLSVAGMRLGHRPRLSASGPHPENLLQGLRDRLPGIDGLLDLRVAEIGSAVAQEYEVLEGPAKELAVHSETVHRRDTVYVCGRTDPQTVKAGFAWLNTSLGKGRLVVFCVRAETGLANALTPDREPSPDQAGNLIRVHSRISAVADPEHIKSQSLTEKLARAFHDEYLAHMASTEPSDQPEAAQQSWNELSEVMRNSNRDQAVHVAKKLALMHCVVVPFSKSLPEFAFSDGEVDELARVEHERWCAERSRAGISYGIERTPKTHPDMVPWEMLSDVAKEKDRIFMRALSGLLATEGLMIARLPEF